MSFRCLRDAHTLICKWLQEGAAPGREGICLLKVLSQRGTVSLCPSAIPVPSDKTWNQPWQGWVESLSQINKSRQTGRVARTYCLLIKKAPGWGGGKRKANALSNLGERQKEFWRKAVLAFLWGNFTNGLVGSHYCRKVYMNKENLGNIKCTDLFMF